MTQDELKTLVGQAALSYVTPDTIVGVGTGSTVILFIEELSRIKGRIRGAVSSSEASTERLKAHDENNECGVGDRVLLMETRPLSAGKRWRIVQILEKAK